ncbi:MAG: repeat domain protein [Chthonomonadales bacterium]|nr:repeat domain protein [Chthonomonadales bacterium]
MTACSFDRNPGTFQSRVLKVTQIWIALCLLLLCPGLARGQTWQSKSTTVNGTTFFPLHQMLLTDGTVMVHDSQTSDWWKLTPDSAGSYVNGAWTQIASLPDGYAPLYYASAVLADGRVVVFGGEYNNGGSTPEDVNLGAIYDPVADTWTPLDGPDGWEGIGDASCVVLPDGRFLMADLFTSDGAVLDPTTLTWTQLSFTGKADQNSEETWTLLPDGTILTVDCQNGTHAERYDPLTDTWTSAGSTGVQIAFNKPGVGFEVGPGVLRMDGTVIAFGASGHTALYHPSTNSWTTGPDFPAGLDIADGPACLLPNGNVFCVASPGFYNVGAKFFEYDGTNLNAAPPTLFNAPDITSYYCNMLMLPTGQVLFSYGDGEVEIYTPTGGPQDAWRPTITNCPTTVAPGGSYTITGTQLNGLSQTSIYGDDDSNATNYPLVRITNRATGHVIYFRTHDHSTMAVATGAASVSTHFDVPSTAELGLADLVVVANGIASIPITITVSTTTGLTLTSLSVAPSSVIGGQTATGTVTLSDNAPTGGAVVTLGSNNSGVATGPVTVTVAAGSASANFTINTNPVSADTIVVLSATLNGVTQTANLTVLAPAALSLGVAPTTVLSGQSATGTVTLTGPAPAGGIAVALSSSKTTVASVPASVSVAAGATTGTFTVTTSNVTVNTTVTLTATLGVSVTAPLTVTPPGVTGLSIAPASVKGGQTATGTVTLSSKATGFGAVVNLSSNKAAFAGAPASVTVPSGSTTANFTITTHGGSVNTLVTFTASLSGTQATAPLTVTPPDLTSVTLSPNSVKGGLTSTGTVTISDQAANGSIVVTLSSNNAAATVPASVTIAAGATTATFAVNTTAVSSATAVTLTGAFNGQTQTGALTVQAPLVAGLAVSPGSIRSLQTATATVTLDGPAPTGGSVITLSSNNPSLTTLPPTVTVSAGATTATFPVTVGAVTSTTTVQLSATLGTSTKTTNLVITFNLPFDYNKDGHNDLILQNTVTNLVTIWYMNALTVTGASTVDSLPTQGYKVVGGVDFNNDGNPDLVFQNQTTGQVVLWYLNGIHLVGGEALSQSPNAAYKVVGTGDFNGDGNVDLVFQHPSGSIVIWYLQGAKVTGGVTLPFQPAVGYNIVGVGDFNKDGKQDLLFQNASNNQVVVWYMNGANFIGGGAISYLPPLVWKVKGVADYNNDGIPDIVFQNSSTNQVLIWFMNGLTVTGGDLITVQPAAPNRVVGPH